MSTGVTPTPPFLESALKRSGAPFEANSHVAGLVLEDAYVLTGDAAVAWRVLEHVQRPLVMAA